MANNQLNWSHFKPDFSGKPEEGMKAHLLRTNDWMTMHDFPDDQKVRRFCLTLLGEARLWYEMLNAQQQQLIGQAYRKVLGSNIQSLAIPENSISMCGDLSILMKQQTLQMGTYKRLSKWHHY